MSTPNINNCFHCMEEYTPIEYKNVLTRLSFDFCSDKCKNAFFNSLQTVDYDAKVNMSPIDNNAKSQPINIPLKQKSIKKHSQSMVSETILQSMKQPHKPTMPLDHMTYALHLQNLTRAFNELGKK